MTAPSTSEPRSAWEQLLARRADECYHLALLLTLDERRAATALRRAVAALPVTARADEGVLLRTLLAQLPRARPFARPLRWPHVTDKPQQTVLRALPQLAPPARLALALGLLRPHEPDLLRDALGVDAVAASAAPGAALLQLAQAVAAALPEAQAVAAAFGAAQPEICAQTRQALLDGSAASAPLVRGHLAVCDACRAAEAALETWTDLVYAALTTAFKPVQLPDDLAAQLRATLYPETAPAPARRWPLVFLPLGVALLAALLWLPAARAPVSAARPIAPAAPADARALVQRATAQLYAVPAERGIWRGRWQIYWPFADGSATMLNADLWRAPDGRHRVQLIHQAGGAPYEFELAASAETFYNVSRTYAPSLYPLLFDEPSAGARIRTSTDEAAALLRARLDSGAWGIAARYLALAAAAPDLRVWGTRRTEDGNTVQLIGFRTFSPLGRTPDASDAPNVTALLAFDINTGALREISELVGRGGGEQVGRTVWRFLSWETVPPGERPFELDSAWNGNRNFVPTDRLINARLPLIRARSVVSPLRATRTPSVLFPADTPPGADAAVYIGGRIGEPSTVVYTGPGRYLAVSSDLPPVSGVQLCPDPEQIAVRAQTALVCRRPGQIVLVQLPLSGAEFFNGSLRFSGDSPQVVEVAAQGLSQPELLTILDQLQSLTTVTYARQQPLFERQTNGQPSAEQLIEAALVRAEPPTNAVRRTVQFRFNRQRESSRIPNPYARPAYGGIASRTEIETWTRPVSGTIERVRRITDNSQLVQISYGGQGLFSTYDAPSRSQTIFAGSFGDYHLFLYDIASEMLKCGPLDVTTQADNLIVTLVETDWLSNPCLAPQYRDYYYAQQPGNPADSIDSGPYMVDILPPPPQTVPPLQFRLIFGAYRLLRAAEVRVGEGDGAPVIERWELIKEEEVRPDAVPIELFSAAPRPDALQIFDYRDGGNDAALLTASPQIVSLDEVKARWSTPFFRIQQEAIAREIQIEAAPPQGNAARSGRLDSPIDEAVARGFASRTVYQLTGNANIDGSTQLFMVVQGPAESFGAFLRATASWAESTPMIDVIADGQQISGWQVRDLAGRHTWLLFEREGTLLAVMADTDPQRAAALELVKA